MNDEEIRGPWGVIRMTVELVDNPLGGIFRSYVQIARYYLNGERISEDEARRLIESTSPDPENTNEASPPSEG